jgi:membrane-associated phospholipid phosphatase
LFITKKQSLRKLFCIYIFLFIICSLYSDNTYELSLLREATVSIPTLALGTFSHIKLLGQGGLSTDELNALSAHNINRFDRFATGYYSERAMIYSDFLMYACVLSPLTLNLSSKISNEYIEMNTIIIQSYIFSYAITQFTKTTFLRNRPLAYNENVSLAVRQDRDARYSFISGHTAMSFTGAILTAKIYDDFNPNKNNTWIYATTATAASAVGYLRLRAGKHFPTDILAGAIVGISSAVMITEVHKKTNRNNENTKLPIVLHYKF